MIEIFVNFLVLKTLLGSTVSENKTKVYFIAEIGGNHEGDFSLAKDLLNQAIECGVDAVKFQAYTVME